MPARLKQAAFHLARQFGVPAIVAGSEWRRQRLVILCYHGVSLADEHEWNPELYVTADHLRRRLRFLRREGYQVLPLDDALHRLYAGTLPPRAVAITFDDGTVDFALRGVPVLRELDAPATVYLTTHYCGTGLPVFDTMLAYVLWKGRESGADLAGVTGADLAGVTGADLAGVTGAAAPLRVTGAAAPLRVGTADERARTWRTLYDFAHRARLSTAEKDALTAAVAARLGLDYAALVRLGMLQIMSPEHVRALPAGLVDVQLHTARHRTPRDRALFRDEVHSNAVRIRELLGADRPLRHFCYPSGDYRGEFLAWLPEEGVAFATTCVPGMARRGDHPLLLPRYIDASVTPEVTFEAWVSGLAQLVPRRSKYRLSPARLQLARAG